MSVKEGTDAYEELVVRDNGGFRPLHKYQSLQKDLTLLLETSKTCVSAELRTILRAARGDIVSTRTKEPGEYLSQVPRWSRRVIASHDFHRMRLHTCFLDSEKRFNRVTSIRARLLREKCKSMEKDGFVVEQKFVNNALNNLTMALLKYEQKMEFENASHKEILRHEENCRESREDFAKTMAKVERDLAAKEADFAVKEELYLPSKEERCLAVKLERDLPAKERLLAARTRYLAGKERNLAVKYTDFAAKEKRYLAAKEKRDIAAKERDLLAKYIHVSAKGKHLAAKNRDFAAKEEIYLAAKEARDLAAEERDSAAKERYLAAKEKSLAANERDFAAKIEKYFAVKAVRDLAKQNENIGAKEMQLAAKLRDFAAQKESVLATKETEWAAKRIYLAEKEKNLEAKQRDFAVIEEKLLVVKKEKLLDLAVKENIDYVAKKRSLAKKDIFLVGMERHIAAKDRTLAAKERDFAAKEKRELEAEVIDMARERMVIEVKRLIITARDQIAKHIKVQQVYEAHLKDLREGFTRERSELQKEVRQAISELQQEVSLQKDAFQHILSGMLLQIDVTEETVAADDSCPICMGELSAEKVVFKVSCNHLFHARCITQWMKVLPKCPYCRQDLSVVMENTN